jgi:hypothetical protein
VKHILALLLICISLLAVSRCNSYIHAEKRANDIVFGVNYPYWYAVGQIQQETGCRNVISRDGVGSQGFAQITFRVWRKYLLKHNIKNIVALDNQFLAQAYIIKNCKAQAYSSHMWVWYQIYNGGIIVNKEIIRARNALDIREVSHSQAEKYCKRGYTHWSNGRVQSNCKINYDYSKQVYRYGQLYKTTATTNKYLFW